MSPNDKLKFVALLKDLIEEQPDVVLQGIDANITKFPKRFDVIEGAINLAGYEVACDQRGILGTRITLIPK